jgi:hypothetical protein
MALCDGKPVSIGCHLSAGGPVPMRLVVWRQNVLESLVPQMIRIGPLQKLNLRHNLRLDPDAFFHLLGRQPLSSSSGFLLR